LSSHCWASNHCFDHEGAIGLFLRDFLKDCQSLIVVISEGIYDKKYDSFGKIFAVFQEFALRHFLDMRKAGEFNLIEAKEQHQDQA
jgi:hypothetical protein